MMVAFIRKAREAVWVTEFVAGIVRLLLQAAAVNISCKMAVAPWKRCIGRYQKSYQVSVVKVLQPTNPHSSLANWVYVQVFCTANMPGLCSGRIFI